MVYKLALTMPYDIHIGRTPYMYKQASKSVMARSSRFTNRPAIHLLQVCSQVQREAAPVLYSSNEFAVKWDNYLMTNHRLPKRKSQKC